MSKLYCITDIHGCIEQFKTLLKKINLQKEDTLILMGDYVDRGPDSKGVLDLIIKLKEDHNVVTLLGNHEVMMKSGVTKESEHYILNWIEWGGIETLASYGINYLDFLEDDFILPKTLLDHITFIDSLKLYYETDTHLFVHASPGMAIPLDLQPESHLIWRRPQPDDAEFDYTHVSGKTIISGHTAQETGKPKYLSNKNILIDTGCFFTGILTAYDVLENKFITNK